MTCQTVSHSVLFLITDEKFDLKRIETRERRSEPRKNIADTPGPLSMDSIYICRSRKDR